MAVDMEVHMVADREVDKVADEKEEEKRGMQKRRKERGTQFGERGMQKRRRRKSTKFGERVGKFFSLESCRGIGQSRHTIYID